jgi:hypothetical protein
LKQYFEIRAILKIAFVYLPLEPNWITKPALYRSPESQVAFEAPRTVLYISTSSS